MFLFFLSLVQAKGLGANITIVSYEQKCHSQLPLVNAVRNSALEDFGFFLPQFVVHQNPLSAMSLSEELACLS